MIFRTLTGRFAVLTFLFVMLAEVLILIPSLANFREDYLNERLNRGQIAALAVLASPDRYVEAELRDELLDNVQVLNIVLNRDDERELIISAPMPAAKDETIRMGQTPMTKFARDAIVGLFSNQERILHVIGWPDRMQGDAIEVTMKDTSLRQATWEYARNIIFISLAISVMVGVMLFFAIRALIGQPIARIVRHIQRFQSAPEDKRQIITPGAAITEFYHAEVALAEMETQLSDNLAERKRMVSLGEAVSKISHDLRNMLTTAQLLADRMEMSDDPRVQRVAPKLVSSLSKAVNLCERTLSFGKAEEPAPELAKFNLYQMIEEVVQAEELAIGEEPIKIVVEVPKRMSIWADREQIFRVVSNIVRNARQVLMARNGTGEIKVKALDKMSSWGIVISDDGPGMPQKARTNMFMPFKGSARAGGSGLGLAIASELVANHDGSLILQYSGVQGTAFEITLPKER
ncbi:MAG: HAMP domain-containing sensor histidine kinase [Pseudomonadota bacterium]